MERANQVKVVVSFKFNRGVTPEVYDLLTLFVQMARLNPDNEEMHIMEDIDQPEFFTLIETWKNIDAVQRHTETQYFKDFVSFLAGNASSLHVRKLKHLAA